MTWIATLSALALAALPTMAGAQQQRQKALPTLRGAVAACILVVREEIDKQAGFKISQFDAYSNDDGTVRWFGTNKERFSFEKCMNEMGYPLK